MKTFRVKKKLYKFFTFFLKYLDGKKNSDRVKKKKKNPISFYRTMKVLYKPGGKFCKPVLFLLKMSFSPLNCYEISKQNKAKPVLFDDQTNIPKRARAPRAILLFL